MAGHMGTTRTTIQNLPVIRIDTALNLIFLKGNVPGSDDAYVTVRDSKKKVTWAAQRNVRKGLQQGQWLTGVAQREKDAPVEQGVTEVEGVRDLPMPGMTVGMVKQAGWPAVIEARMK
jgi:large subunit ribosomal protein L3